MKSGGLGGGRDLRHQWEDDQDFNSPGTNTSLSKENLLIYWRKKEEESNKDDYRGHAFPMEVSNKKEHKEMHINMKSV